MSVFVHLSALINLTHLGKDSGSPNVNRDNIMEKTLVTNKDYLFSTSGLSIANFKVISWNMFFPDYLLEFLIE